MSRRISPVLFLLIAAAIGWGDELCSDQQLPSFLTGRIAAEAAWLTPLKETDQLVEQSPSAGLIISSPYWKQIDVLVVLRYQQPEVYAYSKTGERSSHSLYQLMGDIGLMVPISPPNNPRYQFRFGGGFSLFFIRAAEEIGSYLLDDNESDFGNWLKIETPALSFGGLKMRLFAELFTAWSLPQRTHFLLSGVTLESRLW